jgi:hypothetical protein
MPGASLAAGEQAAHLASEMASGPETFMLLRAALLAAVGTVGPLALASQDVVTTVGDAPVILVTGSTGGLGREVARSLAATGAHVIVHGRSEERGRALVAEIEQAAVGSARFARGGQGLRRGDPQRLPKVGRAGQQRGRLVGFARAAAVGGRQ